jgi:2-polyprenyl-3-methyl-5-hydroxy-6-metoxy-1,4-benzoquinol methylase
MGRGVDACRDWGAVVAVAHSCSTHAPPTAQPPPPPQSRTEAYRQALELNPGLLGGARVLDVGCGTGILSMFAARGGAAAVVALDGSDRIAGFARQVGPRVWGGGRLYPVLLGNAC